MKRPMIWFAVLFLGGELIRLAGLLPWQAALLTIVCMYMTGSSKSYFRVTWIRLALPVFFLSGYVVCAAALYRVTPDEALLEEKTVRFSGKVTSVDEKENSYAVEISSAHIFRVGEDTPQKTAGVVVYVEKETGRSLYAGSVVTGRGRLKLPEQAVDPGQFDMRRYEAAKGIVYIVFPDEITVTGEASHFRKVVEDLRRREGQILKSLFDEDEAGILKAMMLGDSSSLEEDTREMYRVFGIAHILAISGLHLSLIGSGLYRMLKQAGLPQRVAALAAAFIVMSYARFVHAGPATMRAVIMFCVLMAGEYIGRRYDGLSALAFSFLIIMICHPLAVTQAGLRYALASLLSLYVLFPAAGKLLGIPKKGRARKLYGLLGPPAAVMAGTMPLAAYYYGEISLVSLPVNLLAMPVLALLMPLGLAAGGIGLISPKLAAFAAGSVHALLLLNRLPEMLRPWWHFMTVRTGCQPAAVTLCGYLVLALFAFVSVKTAFRDKRAFLVLAGLLVIFIPFRRFGSVAVFLDVGQGDCAFIRFDDGTTILSDGGSTDVEDVGKYRIKPCLDHYGVEAVDYAFVSHADADHYSGILELLNASRIRQLVLTKAGAEDEGFVLLAEAAKENGVGVSYAKSGDRWNFGSERVTCIYPGPGQGEGDTNDRSMVLRIDTSRLSMLMTGDISSQVEDALLGRRDLDADILKVPHHGSKYSSSTDFLAAVSPRFSVVSAGDRNRYGHPHAETVERLMEAGTQMAVTRECGAVLLRPEDGNIRISGYLKGDLGMVFHDAPDAPASR